MKENDLVLIEWEDANSVLKSHLFLDDARRLPLSKLTTIGKLVADLDDRIVIATTYSNTDDCAEDLLVIPKKNILRSTVLEKVTEGSK